MAELEVVVDLKSRLETTDSLPHLFQQLESESIQHLDIKNITSCPDQQVTPLLHALLTNATHLRRLELDSVNLPGSIFRKERPILVCGVTRRDGNIVSLPIQIESHDASGHPIIRDDAESFSNFQTFDDKSTGYYLKTVVSPEPEIDSSVGNIDITEDPWFHRIYATIGWLPLRKLVVSNCQYSSVDMLGLVAACFPHLETLHIENCPVIDNKFMFGLVALLASSAVFRTLVIKQCDQITEHGLVHLTNLPAPIVERLQTLIIHSASLDRPHISSAILHSLEFKNFSGVLAANHHVLHGRGRAAVVDALRLAIQRSSAWLDMSFHRFVDVDLSTVQKLDLSNSLVDDATLERCLPFCGSHLTELYLDNTFITETGLELLALCPNLRVLRLSNCLNLINRELVNKVLAVQLAKMPHLAEFHCDGVCVGGRALTKIVSASLHVLSCARSSVSQSALFHLSAKHQTLTHLNVSGCRFVNSRFVHTLPSLRNLKFLNISHCPGLTHADLESLSHWDIARATNQAPTSQTTEIPLRKLVVSGIDTAFGQMMQQRLSFRVPADEFVEVEVIGNIASALTRSIDISTSNVVASPVTAKLNSVSSVVTNGTAIPAVPFIPLVPISTPPNRITQSTPSSGYLNVTSKSSNNNSNAVTLQPSPVPLTLSLAPEIAMMSPLPHASTLARPAPGVSSTGSYLNLNSDANAATTTPLSLIREPGVAASSSSEFASLTATVTRQQADINALTADVAKLKQQFTDLVLSMKKAIPNQ